MWGSVSGWSVPYSINSLCGESTSDRFYRRSRVVEFESGSDLKVSRLIVVRTSFVDV